MKTAACIMASFLSVAAWAGQPGFDFEAADRSGDGRVSLKEFKKCRVITMKKEGWSNPYPQITRAFQEQDRDQNGYLSREETAPAVGVNRLEVTFSERGGQLSFDEFEALVRRMLRDQGRYAMHGQFAETFKMRDRDRDGLLSREEFTELPVEIHRRFQLADEDRNRLLDPQEFEVFAIGKENLKVLAGVSDVHGWLEQIFENRDDDDDDFLSRAELYESAEERRRQFKRADADRDGFINLEELQACKTKEADLSLWRDMALDQFRLNFMARDKNGDGIITEAEYFSAPLGIGNQIVFSVIK